VIQEIGEKKKKKKKRRKIITVCGILWLDVVFERPVATQKPTKVVSRER
jgi:hypothetical protein